MFDDNSWGNEAQIKNKCFHELTTSYYYSKWSIPNFTHTVITNNQLSRKLIFNAGSTWHGSEMARKPSIRIMTNILYTFGEILMKYESSGAILIADVKNGRFIYYFPSVLIRIFSFAGEAVLGILTGVRKLHFSAFIWSTGVPSARIPEVHLLLLVTREIYMQI